MPEISKPKRRHFNFLSDDELADAIDRRAQERRASASYVIREELRGALLSDDDAEHAA